MRRGFTFIELVFASTISVVVFTAILIAFSGLWQLVRGTAAEMEIALHARNVRERLIFHLGEADDGFEYDGLYTAEQISSSYQNGGKGVTARFVRNNRDANNLERKVLGGMMEVLSRFPRFEEMQRDGAIDLRTDRRSAYGGQILYGYLTLRLGKGARATEYYERFAITESAVQQGDLPPSLEEGAGEYGVFDIDEEYLEYRGL